MLIRSMPPTTEKINNTVVTGKAVDFHFPRRIGPLLVLFIVGNLFYSAASAQQSQSSRLLAFSIAASSTLMDAIGSDSTKHITGEIINDGKILAPGITCPGNVTKCTTGSTFTNSGTTLNATGTVDPTCPGTLTFSYTSSGAGVSPATGSTLNGAVFNVGVTTITWTVTDACSNTASCSFNVTVNAAPPAISASPSSQAICSGNPITTINFSGAATYNWTRDNTTNLVGIDPAGPGGTTSVSGAMTNLTATSQTTTFTVISIIGGCPSVTTATVTVNPPPTVAAITGLDNVCQNSTIDLNDATTGGTWTSSNTAIATVNAATGLVTGIAPGAVTITYSFTNGSGCTNTAIKVINVQPVPTVTASVSATTICAGTSVNLTSTSSISQSTTSSFTNTQQAGFQNAAPLQTLTRCITVSGIPVATLAAITNISVTVNLDHQRDKEVEIYLVAPGGTLTNAANGTYAQTIVPGQSIALSADQGGTGANYTNTVFSSGAAQTIAASGQRRLFRERIYLKIHSVP